MLCVVTTVQYILYIKYLLHLVMEVASGEYGNHMARLVQAVNEGKCEKDYKSETNGDEALESFFWLKTSNEVQTQTMLYILKNVMQFFFKSENKRKELLNKWTM